jgi:drug/metabolite transporter (DMT)-like permease
VKNQRKALIFGLLAVLAWSTVATVFKLALRHIDHFQLLFLANVFSILSLGLVLAIQGKLGKIRTVGRRRLAMCAGLGVLNPFLYYVILFKAYSLLPAQVAQPLNFTWALTMSWLAVPLLGHRLRLRDVLAGVICYSGVLVISTGGDFHTWRMDSGLGVALALASTLIWALYWLGNTRLDFDPVAGLFLGFLFSLVPVTAATWWFSDFQMPAVAIALGAYVGAVEMGFTFALWLTAMRLTTSTARLANLIFLAPFLSLVFIHFVLGEHLRVATLPGLVLIVAGLWFQSSGKKEP